MILLKGQKVDLTKGKNLNNVSLYFGWSTVDALMSIDASCFLLSDKNICVKDEDFIFYGNSSVLNGAVTHAQQSGADKEAIQICLSKLPNSVAKIAFTVTIHEAEIHGQMMKDVSNMYLRLVNTDTGDELFRYEYGSDLTMETAIVVGDLYRHNGEWKFNAIGSGFNGGLAALCKNFGLEIEEEETKKEVAVAVEEKRITTIDLRKKIVQITLEKKQMTNVAARVGLVLDISGSMLALYRNGTVQEVVERILAVACKFDNDASMDVWVYDNEFSRLPPATEKDFDQYVQKHIMNNQKIHKFGRNNEPPVMEDVILKYTAEEKSSLPVFIIFINDGGVVKPIKKVITEAAVQPIFWQFVGIGDSDFEVLKKLDAMEGRIVDNANFIHIEDIASVSDETLYNQLLNEFPLWLKAATDKRIIRT
jgi:stress response protein SCP2